MNRKRKATKTIHPRQLLDSFLSDLDAYFEPGGISKIEDAVVPLLPRETVYVSTEYTWHCPYCSRVIKSDILEDSECDECGLLVSLELP